MKVILLQDVDKLGRTGELAVVKAGYARNFLFPNNKAKPASEANVKMLDLLKKKREALEKKRLDELKAVADKLAALSITISAQAGEDEKLFGSVSVDMISEALKAQGMDIDKKIIVPNETIKKLGVFTVDVKLHPEVKASLKVWVVKEQIENI